MQAAKARRGLHDGFGMQPTLRCPVRTTAATCVRHPAPAWRWPLIQRKPTITALAWSTASGSTALPWLERKARLSLLERERDDAVQLAQVCATRSHRLLARVEKLQEYADLRRAAGDDAAVEVTLKTQAQVHAILAKTISRAHNNYALAARLEDLIGLLQQQLLLTPRASADLQQALSHIAATPADVGATVPDTQGDNNNGEAGAEPVRLLNGSSEGDAVAAATSPEQELMRAQSSPGQGAWTSSTLGSMSEVVDWGMASIDWASLVDPALASALTGHDGTAASTEDPGASTDAAANNEGSYQTSSHAAAPSVSDEDRPLNRVRPACDDGSDVAMQPGGSHVDTSSPVYTEELHSATETADNSDRPTSGSNHEEAQGTEGRQVGMGQGVGDGHGLTEEARQDHDNLVREMFGSSPAQVSDEWLQQAQVAAAAAMASPERAPANDVLDSASCGIAEECEIMEASTSETSLGTENAGVQAAASASGEQVQPSPAPAATPETGLVLQTEWQQAVRKAVQAAAQGGQQQQDVLTDLNRAIAELQRALHGEAGH